MNIQIPDTTAFDGNMSSGDTIQLPFACPPFFVLNGQAVYEEQKDARFFGGWACSNDRLQEGAEAWEGAEYPPKFLKSANLVIKKNQRLDSHISRFLHVAVIGLRQFSTIRDEANNKTRRVAPFTKGARPAIQVLAVLGYKAKDDPAIHPYLPVMLTAGGYQVGHLRSAIQAWEKAVKSMYKPAGLKPNTFPGLFYATLGTFGEKPQFEDRGESSITPIHSLVPDGFDAASLEQRYVGEDTAKWMIDLSGQAHEWLHAFDALAPTSNAESQAEPPADPNEPRYIDEP